MSGLNTVGGVVNTTGGFRVVVFWAVRGWRTGDIRPDRYDRLAQLRDLVLLLSHSLTARGVGRWLHAKNRLLDGERPIDLLAKERYQEVRGAAESFIDGSCVRL